MSNQHWYLLAADGRATLCADRADAEHEARNADTAWPAMGPHRAVQLVEAGFDACDMATASAQGFRDGVASGSAWSEPVASYALRLLVAAALITQAKADEALRLAAELTAAPGC